MQKPAPDKFSVEMGLLFGRTLVIMLIVTVIGVWLKFFVLGWLAPGLLTWITGGCR